VAASGKTPSASVPAGLGTLLPALTAVRTNCHISDARHATDYTLCVYLLKMREYYRWENDIPFNAALPHQQLTSWLSEREEHWDSLQGQSFRDIPMNGTRHDPFDAGAINDRLNNLGFVYSGGYGRNMKPVFFLAALEKREQYHGYTLMVSGKEYARDLSAPPAMSQGKSIFVRRESLRRLLWEKVEEWRWNRPANAMQKAIECYDFDNLPGQSLEAMTDNELQSVTLHEIGEVEAGARLGPEWEELLAAIPHSKTEIMLRAVRDNLADALSTLPSLLREVRTASLHFYMANLTGMRRELSPKLLAAYEDWSRTGNTGPLEKYTAGAVAHWQGLAESLLEQRRKQGSNCQQTLTSSIEQNPF
jgi:hypothetical protein